MSIYIYLITYTYSIFFDDYENNNSSTLGSYVKCYFVILAGKYICTRSIALVVCTHSIGFVGTYRLGPCFQYCIHWTTNQLLQLLVN